MTGSNIILLTQEEIYADVWLRIIFNYASCEKCADIILLIINHVIYKRKFDSLFSFQYVQLNIFLYHSHVCNRPVNSIYSITISRT